MTDIHTLTHDTLNHWADDDQGPVALTLRQQLLPIDGEGGIVFPPTYADIGYSIDTLSDGTRVAQIDSVGSQANRLEPLFTREPYRHLVPQVEFDLGPCKETGAARTVSLLELAHRAGDAVVRSSSLAAEIDAAFKTLLRSHDAEPLARLAPTSLVFGTWDSRGTQVKRPRLIRAFIRAEDIDVLHAAAQYNSVWKLLDDDQKKVLADEAKAKKTKLSDQGFNDVPAVFRKTGKGDRYKYGHVNDDPRVLGGIIARGPITRHVTLNLIALRSIQGRDPHTTQSLRRYLLGLALVAATADMDPYLREGCLLRHAHHDADLWEAISRRGTGQWFGLSTPDSQATLLRYAESAAAAFNVQQPPERYRFDIKLAKALLAKKVEENETDAEG